MKRFIMPKFYCPFPSQVNTQVEAVHQHTLSWARDHQLLQKAAAIRRFDASRFAWLTARAYPLAGFTELALINDFLSWLFLLDDQFDDGTLGRQPERMQIIMRGLIATLGAGSSTVASPLDGPIAAGLRDLWQRTLPLTTLPWQERFLRHLLAYFDSYHWETLNRMQGLVPDIERYIEKRQDTGAMLLALDYIELTEHIIFPPELYASSQLQVLIRITNNAVCWSNDIISLEKEIVRGDLNNLVLAVQQQYRCTLQEAVDRVNCMTTGEIKLFELVAEQVPALFPAHKQALCRYIACMQAWIAGNLAWSFETDRYSAVEQKRADEQLSYLEAILPTEPPI